MWICKKSFLRMKYKDFLIFFFCLTPVLKLKRAILNLKGSQAYFFDVPIMERHLTFEVWELMFYCEAFWDRKWVGKTLRIWNHSTMSPLRKRGVFCPFGWKNLHGCDICESTGEKNPFTTVSYNNLQSWPWKGTKILKITFWVLQTSSLEKAFKRQFQMQRRTSTIKPWILQGGTLFSIKKCILWLGTTCCW